MTPATGTPLPIDSDLIFNSDVEINLGGMPVDWEPFYIYPGAYWWVNDTSYVSDVYHSYSHSLKNEVFYGYADNYVLPAGWGQEYFVENVVTAPATENTFEASVWVKASQTTNVRLALYGYSPGYGLVSKGALSNDYTISTSWTQISYQNTFGPEVIDISLALLRLPQASAGDVWFDDIEVKLLP